MPRVLVSLMILLAGEIPCLCTVLTNCSEGDLRAAIARGGTVTFACSGTIGVSLIVITNSVRLDGSTNSVTLSGGNSQPIFEVSSNCTLELINLSLTDGRHFGAASPGYPAPGLTGFGAAVRINGSTLIASSCLFSNNAVIGGSGRLQPFGSYGGHALGGAIYATNGSVFLTNCTFIDNTAKGGDGGYGVQPYSAGATRGGAIYVDGSTLDLTDCSFLSNTVVQPIGYSLMRGGAVYANFSDVRARNSTFAANRPMPGITGFYEGLREGGALYLIGSSATFQACSFANNSTTGPGGAILSTLGTTIVSSCTFDANSTDSGGGVINARGELSVHDSSFRSNNARVGGAFFHQGKFFVLSNTLFIRNSANSGGGVYFDGSELEMATTNNIRNCIFDSNTASAGTAPLGGGGAIYSKKNTSIDNCSFVANVAHTSYYLGGGGAVYFTQSNQTTNSVVNSIFISNTVNSTIGFLGAGPAGGGGAIFTERSTTLSNCAFALNSANLFGGPGGGGAVNQLSDQTCMVVNCTFALNAVNSTNSSAGGGAFYSWGGPSIFQLCTIASNACTSGSRGAGILIAYTNGRALLGGVILAGNFVGNRSENVAGVSASLVDSGYNLSSDATPFFSGTSRTNVDPKLALLTDNGGDILTMALLAGSPAIDGFSGLNCPSVDARGVARPQRLACDIGAYELIAFQASIVRSNQNIFVSYPSTLDHTYTLQTSGNPGPPWRDVQSKTSATATVEFSIANSNHLQFFRIRE